MIAFRRLLPSDIEQVCLQDQQARLSPLQAKAEYREALAAGPIGWTCHEDGTVHGVGGIVPQWDAPHLGRAWALVANAVPREAWHGITAFTRAALRTALADFPAIETEVDLVHSAGHRWAHLLGFRLTGVRPLRQADTQMPTVFYTLGAHEGVPISVAAALDFLDRVIAGWLDHPPGTDPGFILKAALPKPRLVRRAA